MFATKDFIDIASHDSVRQALARLAKGGTIRRLMRGVYEYPRLSALLNAPASPDPDAIARAIARSHGWTILPSGDAAVNLLGLSTQVPAEWQYLSDGPSRTHRWSGGTLVFRHRANKETTALSPDTALLTQALKKLGKDRVGPAELARIRARLDAGKLKRAAREARYVTSWVYEVIRELAAEDSPRA